MRKRLIHCDTLQLRALGLTACEICRAGMPSFRASALECEIGLQKPLFFINARFDTLAEMFGLLITGAIFLDRFCDEGG